MQRVKSLQFLNVDQKLVKKKQKIEHFSPQNLQKNNEQQNYSNSEQEQAEFIFKQSLPNYLSNVKTLTQYMKQKVQKLKYWQKRQEQLKLKLQSIRQQKVLHLQKFNKKPKQGKNQSERKKQNFIQYKSLNKLKTNQNYQQSPVKKITISRTETKPDNNSSTELQSQISRKKNKSRQQNVEESPTRSIKNISKNGYEITYFTMSKDGDSKKENQDSHFQFTKEKNTKNLSFFGVCDGHGEFGKQLSSFLAQKFTLSLKQKKINDKKPITSFLNQNFNQILSSIYQSEINIERTGSTLNFCLILNNIIHILNIGDSRCIIGQKNFKGKWDLKSFTEDHILQNQKQTARIVKMGGIIKRCIVNGKEAGPLRIWNQKSENNKPYGITMTRSIGDMCLSGAGISHRPQIISYSLNEILSHRQRLIVIGTDGLYQNFQNKQVIQLLSKNLEQGKSVQEAVELLIKEAFQKNISMNQASDDITVTVLYLR